MLELLGCHLVRCNSRLSRRAADTHVDGPSPAAVDEHAASAAAGGTRVFLYLVPTSANPTGRCLSIAHQHDLLKVARTRGPHIIEDDVYRDTTPQPATIDVVAGPRHSDATRVVLEIPLAQVYGLDSSPVERKRSNASATAVCSIPVEA